AVAVSVSGIATNATCFGGSDGSITVTNSAGATVVITNSTNQVVSNTNLPAGTYTLTATATGGNQGQNCTATATVTINDGDGTPPVISQLPNETTINCPVKPEFAQATATDNVDTTVSLAFDDVTTQGQCAGSYSVTRTWTAADDCGNTSTKSQTINVQDNTAPTITPPQNIILSSGVNCVTDISPTITGNPAYNDICDSNLSPPTYTDSECFGNSNNQEINAGNGNYFPFTITGFDGTLASNIEKIALTFETNQGKGRAEFTLIAPNGQGIILVGSYCTGGACDDATSNTKELYLPVFYSNSSGYTKWNNNNFIQDGVSQNFTPNGATSSTNTIPELTSYVSSFENFTGPMNGTWLIYSRKQANVNGSIEFKSVCLTPKATCLGNKVISRTWTVTDACGNTATANQTITIQDTTAPTVNASNNSSTVSCISAATIPTPPDATDECSGILNGVLFSTTDTPNPLTCEGTREYKYKYTDACGNFSYWVYTYTIEKADFTMPDNDGKTVACVADIVAPTV
ncbi:HYR-like domain-containing protein, partial [Flavobacterium rhamnosiphilum]|uniref:HYR-like domain-containing protein n=1 Tax=Flavobacterium rhamnosiphilum TaxID=2541724 RepID=UPI00197A89B2